MSRLELVDNIIRDYFLIYGIYMPEEEIEHLTDLSDDELKEIYYMQLDDKNK